jgi:Fe2+ or Zn2+ uptake regulation protein
MTSIHEHHDTIQEAILAAFRATGHRVTSQRLNLLNVLREEGGFLDAEEIYRRAAPDGEDLSLATVYRALALFKEMGLVEGRFVGNEQVREEYRFRALSETYTLVCKRCGAIVPVEPDMIDAFREEVSASMGVTILGAHSCFIGYCPECTAILAAEEPDS